MGSTQVSKDIGVNNENVMRFIEPVEYYAAVKNDKNQTSHCNMDGNGENHVKESQSAGGRQMLHGLTHL